MLSKTTRSVEAVAAAIGNDPHRMTIGLKPMPESQWIERLDDQRFQLQEKCRVVKEHPDTLALTDSGQEGVEELIELLIDHLCEHLPGDYERSANAIRVNPIAETLDLDRLSPLELLARLVPEDFCLMRENDCGEYLLAAAALCFPTRWRLASKVGKPMLEIHEPVPGYAEQIGAATDKLMRSVRTERPLWRQNWSLLDADTLYQPVRLTVATDRNANGLAQRLWLRSERQTLRRLAHSGDVVFSIRIRQARLDDLLTINGFASRLLQQLQTMSADMRRYKGLLADWSPLVGLLETTAANELEREAMSPPDTSAQQ